VLTQRFNDDWHLESRFRAEQARDDALFAFTKGVAANNITATRTLEAFQTDVGSYYWRNDLIGRAVMSNMKHTILTGVELGRQTYSNQIGQTAFTSINMYNPVYGIGTVPVTLPITTLVHSFANAAGGYVQDQVDLFDKLHVLVGARGDYFFQHTNSLGVNTKAENYGFSPRIGVTYQPIEPLAVYANVTRSFVPVFGVSGAATNNFIPQTATGYEAGIKTDIVPGRLMSTLAIYRLLINNALVTDPSNPTLSLQVGKQRSQGVEYDLTAQLTAGWKVITTYAYTDARDVEDTTFPVGNRLPNIPRNMGKVWSTYDFQGGPLKGFGVGGGVLAIGKRAGDLQNDFYLPSFTRLDMALYYRRPEVFTRTNLTAQLNVQNLLDTQYFLNGGGGRGFGANPGSPLAFMGSVKLEFN
jgi:iron complex outermembrane receptor protein